MLTSPEGIRHAEILGDLRVMPAKVLPDVIVERQSGQAGAVFSSYRPLNRLA